MTRSRITTYGPVLDEAHPSFKEALVGWTIVSVGLTKEYTSRRVGTSDDILFPEAITGDVEGGLTLILKKDNVLRTVVLGYTELGEWIEHMEDKLDSTP
jgi:hypothetical protein